MAKDDWSTQDAVALRQFISQNPKFLDLLKISRPEVTGKTMEECAMTGCAVKGYDDCLANIKRMLQDPLPVDDPGFAHEN